MLLIKSLYLRGSFALFVLLTAGFTAQGQCTNYVISASGGLWENEISWDLVDENGILVANGLATLGTTFCLPDGCYTVNLYDSFGDGWNGAVWTISEMGVLLQSETMIAGSLYSADVALGGATCGTVACPDPHEFSAFGGLFEGEISWTLSDDLGLVVSSGFATTGELLCLTPGCYTLELFDSFGDGWNDAVWTLVDPTGLVIGSGTMLAGSYQSVIIEVGGADCGVEYEPPLTVESGVLPAEALITDVFLGDCLEASNVVYTGAPLAVGTFANGFSLGIDEGIILTTGSVYNAPGPNISGSTGTNNAFAGDPLLDLISGVYTYDAAMFSFDFTASTDQVTFTYVFASDEYPEFVCGGVNDAFGFFVSGPGYAPNTNIAIVPGTADPVTINNVNDNGDLCPPFYPAYYEGNLGGSVVEYDGYTVPMEAVINTVPCETYTITIGIADGGDGVWDSAVFLQAESFAAGVDVAVAAIAPSGGQSQVVNCEDYGSFLFVNQGTPITEDVVLTFSLTGTAVGGFDFENVPLEVVFPAGETSVEIDITGILAQLDANPETVILTLENTCSCNAPESAILYLCSLQMLSSDELDFEALPNDDHGAVTCYVESTHPQWVDRFIIERSLDADAWEYVGELSANEGQMNYTIEDGQPFSGRSYYRVIEQRSNGEVFRSLIDAVFIESRKVVVFPNPGNGVFKLAGIQLDDLRIVDARGRRIPFETIGEDGICFDGAPGMYHLFSISDPARHIALVKE